MVTGLVEQEERTVVNLIETLRNAEARRQVADKEYMHSFTNTDELRAYFDAL